MRPRVEGRAVAYCTVGLTEILVPQRAQWIGCAGTSGSMPDIQPLAKRFWSNLQRAAAL